MKRTLRIVFLLMFFSAAFSLSSFSQAVGDYGSVMSGNWGTLATWGIYNGAIFVGPAGVPPTQSDNVFINATHTVTVEASPKVCKNLTVRSTGKLFTNQSTAGSWFVEVHGNIQNDGTIGNSGTFDRISFDFDGTSDTVFTTGGGNFEAAVFNKSTSTNSTTNLFINMNVTLRYSGTQIYNGLGVASTFNVTVGSGTTLTLVGGDAAIDGITGTGAFDQGGTFTINGIMNVQGTLYLTTNNSNALYPCNWIINGELKAATVNAGASGNAKDSLTVNNGGKFNLTGTAAFSVLSVTNNTFIFNTGSTVEYSANANQSVKVQGNFPVTVPGTLAQYYDLLISGTSGTKTLAGNMGVKRNITITGAAILSPSTFSINLAGNWTNYNQSGFTEGVAGQNVTFNGAVNQYITCPGGESFNYLGLSNFAAPGTTGLYFNNDVAVANQFSFNATNKNPLYLNLNKLILTNISPGAFLFFTGGTTTYNYVQSETAVGTAAHASNPSIIEWTLDAVANSYVYPFGVNGTKIPFTLAKKTTGGNVVVGVSTRATATPNNMPWDSTTNVPYVTQMTSPYLVTGTNGSDSSAIDRWWDIQPATALPIDSITFTYRKSENTILAPYNTGPLIPQNWTGGGWARRSPLCGVCNVGSTGAGTDSVTINNVVDSVLNPYSIIAAPWVLVGFPKRLLPIELIEFTARLTDGVVISKWATSSEINNKFFTLERSKDGKTFIEVGTVEGAGNSSVIHYYGYVDEHPYTGLSYYRLRQTDYDGKFSFSHLVPVFNKDKNSSWYVFPNPATDQIRIASTGDELSNATFRLFNLEGSLIKSVVLDMKSQSVFTVDLKDFSNGIYIGKISDNYHEQVFKIVKE